MQIGMKAEGGGSKLLLGGALALIAHPVKNPVEVFQVAWAQMA